MNYRFYIGGGGNAWKIISEMLSARDYASVYRDALIEATGAKNLFYYASEPERPRGFVFGEHTGRTGLKFGAAVPEGFTYFPDTATEEGVEFEAALLDTRLRFDPEIWLLRTLKITGEVRGHCEHCRNMRGIYKPRAFWVDDQFAICLKIPAELTPYPEIPEWFREVRESEWLARQGQ